MWFKVFRQAALRRALAPYFQLTQAVRMGNLQRFGEVLENFGSQFRTDHTYTLILRLRHNVIKTAIRSVGLSYSRIAPSDIAQKLGLDSPEDAEFIVAKVFYLKSQTNNNDFLFVTNEPFYYNQNCFDLSRNFYSYGIQIKFSNWFKIIINFFQIQYY